MKRVIFTSAATVAGLVALLSFKTQAQPITTTLPSAATSESSATSTASSSATATGSATKKSTAKTFTGQAVTTRYGIVQVKVTAIAGKITDAALVQLTGFDGRSQQINSWAGPQLLQETMKKQSAQVDTVSGATYTSDGYRQSLQSALDKAGIA
jgi:uncharacterized protein with FMN-binding domain